LLHEAQTLSARKKILDKSPKKANQSPIALKDTRNVLQEKAQNLMGKRKNANQ